MLEMNLLIILARIEVMRIFMCCCLGTGHLMDLDEARNVKTD